MISYNKKCRNIFKISPTIYENYVDENGDFRIDGLINYFGRLPYNIVADGDTRIGGISTLVLQSEILWVYYIELIRYNVTRIEIEFELL